MLRRTKLEINGGGGSPAAGQQQVLPACHRRDVVFDLPLAERWRYDDMHEDTRCRLTMKAGGRKVQGGDQVLTRILRLRQFCCHPGLLAKTAGAGKPRRWAVADVTAHRGVADHADSSEESGSDSDNGEPSSCSRACSIFVGSVAQCPLQSLSLLHHIQ